jgi:hypothetical protein
MIENIGNKAGAVETYFRIGGSVYITYTNERLSKAHQLFGLHIARIDGL